MADTSDTTDTKPRARARARRKTTPEALARWDRDIECVRMRRAEHDWETIAERLGYASKGHAYNRFMIMMREIPRDDIESMRALELDRIEKTARDLEPKIAAGDVRAAEVWVKLSERRCRLMGLDAPARREVTVLTADVVDQAILRLNEEVARKEAAALEAGINLRELE